MWLMKSSAIFWPPFQMHESWGGAARAPFRHGHSAAKASTACYAGIFFLKEYKYVVIESSCLLSTVGHFSIFSVYGCKSNYKVRSKIRDHTRSIPPFHTPLPYLFEGSVPYLCSIPLFHTSDPYVMIYIYIYLYIYSLILHLHAHTWAHIHTWVCTCKNTFTMPKPCDCVGKSVPAAIPTLLCDGRDVLGCC